MCNKMWKTLYGEFPSSAAVAVHVILCVHMCAELEIVISTSLQEDVVFGFPVSLNCFHPVPDCFIWQDWDP